MRVVMIIFLLQISSLSFANSVIDLGNLEIEGEVRRPMINLFHNPMVTNDSYQLFAHELILNIQSKITEFNTKEGDNNNKVILKALNDFEDQSIGF